MPRRTFETDVADLTQSIGLLVRRVRAAAATQDLSWTETSVMARLAKAGPATTADLARAQGMRPQSMRTILESLEQMGMIERTPHATDGRQVNIELTPQGAAAQKSAGDAKRSWLAQSITRLEPQEREALFAASSIMKRLAEAE